MDHELSVIKGDVETELLSQNSVLELGLSHSGSDDDTGDRLAEILPLLGLEGELVVLFLLVVVGILLVMDLQFQVGDLKNEGYLLLQGPLLKLV